MNILLFDSQDKWNDEYVCCDPSRISHILKILKCKSGDTLRVGEINGLQGIGKITQITTNTIHFKLNLTESSPDALACSVVLALPRPQQLKRILVHLSSLGIKDIHLIQTQKVEKNYWQSPVLGDIRKYLIEGLEQAKDTKLPSVSFHKNLHHFLGDIFPKLASGKKAWIAHPGCKKNITTSNESEQLIVIGPEGGFTDAEVSLFTNAGCQCISLGPRILKTETAIPVLIGYLFDFS